MVCNCTEDATPPHRFPRVSVEDAQLAMSIFLAFPRRRATRQRLPFPATAISCHCLPLAVDGLEDGLPRPSIAIVTRQEAHPPINPRVDLSFPAIFCHSLGYRHLTCRLVLIRGFDLLTSDFRPPTSGLRPILPMSHSRGLGRPRFILHPSSFILPAGIVSDARLGPLARVTPSFILDLLLAWDRQLSGRCGLGRLGPGRSRPNRIRADDDTAHEKTAAPSVAQRGRYRPD